MRFLKPLHNVRIGDCVWVDIDDQAIVGQVIARNNSRCVVRVVVYRDGVKRGMHKIFNIDDVMWTKEKENKNGKQ